MLNRNAGKKKLDDLLRCMGKDESFTVSLYDINGLKWVNDTYGHLEGDRLLVFVAQSIRKNLEGNDFIFRLSGDEFIVVFLNKSVREAEMWMQRMLGMLEERRLAQGMHYDVTFSYGFANITAGKNLSVSDVLSIADSQMYIRKRDHHIQQGDSRLKKGQERLSQPAPFQLNRSYLFEALAECTDEYLFAGNLKTGEFLHSYRMMIDFGLPAQVLGNSSAFWGERIHPEDRDEFLRCNQEIVEGRAERYTVSYRVKNVKGQWVHLLATGRMIRDEQGVHGGLGLDVVECEADIVLVHLVRGDLPGDEFAEQAVIGHLRFLSSKGCGGMAPIRTNSLPHGAAPRPREPAAAGTSPPVGAYRCETTRSPMPAQPTTLPAGVAASFRSPVRQPSSSTSVTARRMSSAASFMPKL